MPTAQDARKVGPVYSHMFAKPAKTPLLTTLLRRGQGLHQVGRLLSTDRLQSCTYAFNFPMSPGKSLDTPGLAFYTMCIHISIQAIISHVEQMNAEELDSTQQAIDRRRQQLGDKPVSTVVERRNYGNGILQLEKRAYRRKDAKLTERGPYWYFHFREGGKQRTLYIGKTNNPETVVDEKLSEEPTMGEGDG